MWRTHLDLLNDLDELGQCKSSMRLLYDGEDVTTLSEEQWNAVVVPVDVHTRYHDHAAKAAMFMGDLRRAKDTLRFLQNQAVEEATQRDNSNDDDEQSDRCVLCLSGFGSERAVLRCGHSYHLSPCLEDLKARSRLIACPMRCRIRTDPSEVMIATSKRTDDGSRCRRAVKGSWGTKVTQLVADVLDIRDKGEKGVIFSQWEDMLDIVQEALSDNGVLLARATSLRHIGSRSELFLRDRACTVLLLNVKNGAEGLTLLEATHVFMVEPLLNCGLDSQAINRVHRIGQHKKTYVHRYLMADTIEMKIDQLRVEHLDEEEQLEDSIHESKATMIRAGGIDGGFRSEQELLSVLQP
jgi:E3 ubiquitin-protein ligase SHPRH